jgi:hypothetical protein
MKKRAELSLTQKAMQALSDAVAKVVADHQRHGRPLAVWRNGEAVWMPAANTDALHETPTVYRTRKLKK